MATSLTYNSHTITDLIEESETWEYTGEKLLFSQKFILYGSSEANLETTYNNLKAKMEIPYKNLIVKYFDKTLISTNQTTHVGGFNLKPVISIIEQKGLQWTCKFTTEITMPADTLGPSTSPFKEGIVEVNVNVRIPETNLYEITFSGQFRVISTSANPMSTNYEANIQSLINTYYIGVYHSGKTWDVKENNYEYDHNNKIGNFSYTWREVPVDYTGSGGSKYTLDENILIRNLNREFARIPVQRDKTIAGGLTNQPPIEYFLEGSINIKKDQLTDTQAAELWESEIRDWMLNHLNSVYSMKLNNFEEENIRVDSYYKKLYFRLKGFELKQGNLLRLEATVKTPITNDYVFVKTFNGQPYNENFWLRVPEKTRIITINAESVNKPITDSFFEKWLPVDLFDANAAKGWLELKRTITEQEVERSKIDKNVIYYKRGALFELKYIENKRKIKPTAAILSSYNKRVQ